MNTSNVSRISSEQRKLITDFAIPRYMENDRLHRLKHMLRATRYAMHLCSVEKAADRDVCWAAITLHDIAKSTVEAKHGEIGAREARKFLLEIGIGRKMADRVYEAIYFHDEEFPKDSTIEMGVVWDSDKLDALTPDGIKKRMYPYELEKDADRAIENTLKSYNFYKEMFHTKEGRRIVERCEPYSMKFLEQLRRGGERA